MEQVLWLGAGAGLEAHVSEMFHFFGIPEIEKSEEQT